MRKVSLKRASLLRQVQPVRDALVADLCDFCLQPVPTSKHHVAQGFRSVEGANVPELLLDLCIPCHGVLHRMAGEDNRAVGLVLIERAGRGRNLERLWRVTGRRWPSEECVELWRKRLLTQGS